MGHRWASNIFRYGLQGAVPGLCARVLSPFFNNIILTNDTFVEFGVRKTLFWRLPLPADPPVYTFSGGIITPGLRFPYGIPVEPDAPE